MAKSKLDWDRVREENLTATRGTEQFSPDITVDTIRIGVKCGACGASVQDVKAHWRSCKAFQEDRKVRVAAKEARKQAKRAKKLRAKKAKK